MKTFDILPLLRTDFQPGEMLVQIQFFRFGPLINSGSDPNAHSVNIEKIFLLIDDLPKQSISETDSFGPIG